MIQFYNKVYMLILYTFFFHPFLKISYSRTFSVTKDTYLLCSMQEKLIWVTCNYIAISWGRAVSRITPIPWPPLCNAKKVCYDQMAVQTEAYRGLVTSDQHRDSVSPVQDAPIFPGYLRAGLLFSHTGS